jgi:hypothetical protein
VTDAERDEIRDLQHEFERFRVAVYRSIAGVAAAFVVTSAGAGIVVGGYLGDVDDNTDAVRQIAPLSARVSVIEGGMPRVEGRLVRIEGQLDALLTELRRPSRREGRP